jgi:hypothetical protein
MKPTCIDITIAGDTGLIKRLNRIIPLGERPFYDEPYGRMDGWMGGRTDVDLGGACRTGGGRSCDKKSDQEEIMIGRTDYSVQLLEKARADTDTEKT